ncbi:MAG: endonuclease III [Clostridia bacterium]|nr:endonuclease III [Clostridia bacterium]
MTMKERVSGVISELAKLYPDAECSLKYEHAYQLLFSTRLAAQCTDARVNIVAKELYTKFPTLEAFAECDIEDLEAVVHPCGLYRTKARDLKACAKVLIERFDGIVPDTMEELLTLPGIGRKTASLILGDVYGKPAVVTDTHCIRLSNRIGFANSKVPVQVERELTKIIPPEEQALLCHRFVYHGRAVCTARNPKCNECTLATYCKSSKE